MCTSSCESNYGRDFEYLNGLSKIEPGNRILKKLQGKRNLGCVNQFLNSITSKIG